MQKLIKNLFQSKASLYFAIFISIVIAFLSLTKFGTKQPISFKYLDKLEHAIAYTSLSFFWLLSNKFIKTKKNIIIITCILYGVIIEYLQGATGYRTFDYIDMLANSLGVFIGFGLHNFIKKKEMC